MFSIKSVNKIKKNMTEQEYKKQRAYWLNAALSLNKRIFPRCFRARLREIAKLDAEHDKREYEEVIKEIYQEYISDARQ